jgi:hypothetical protein
MALDLDGNTISWYLNNSIICSPVAISPDTYFISSGDYSGGDITTANFGSTSFTYSPPVGFNSGFYTIGLGGAGITLSNSNLTATGSIASNWASVRDVLGRSTGKWYWEIHCDNSGSGISLGIGTSAASMTSGNYCGYDAYGWGWNSTDGYLYHGAAQIAFLGTWTTGDVIGIALDCDGSTIYFYKNNIQLGSATSLPVTTYYPMASFYSTTDLITARFNANTQSYSAPAGFNAGVYLKDIILPDYGGTGIANNPASTLTITGSYASTFVVTGAYTYTFQGTDTYVGRATTDTLTNKRITPRIGSVASSATPTINTDNVDIYKLTAQTSNITSFTTNLSGTPTDNDILIIEITGTAARGITWGASFEASTTALPTTTVSTDMLTIAFMWNSVTSKWRCMAAV